LLGDCRFCDLEALGHGRNVVPAFYQGAMRNKVREVWLKGNDPPGSGEIVGGDLARLPGRDVDAFGASRPACGRRTSLGYGTSEP
jgi:hypothetical protein